MNEQSKQSAQTKEKKPCALQTLYNRRRELKRAVRDVERQIAEEKTRLKATSAQG